MMQKKVLVLTGSPRKNGNTMMLADAFIKRAQEVGHTVTRFDTAFLKITPCLACGGCFRTGGKCVQKDIFTEEIAEAAKEADVIVFAAPLYWFTFPAQIKNAIDRFYSFLSIAGDIKPKELVLLSSSGQESLTMMDGLLATFSHIAGMFGWRCAGEVLAAGFRDAGSVANSDYPEKAAKLAEKLAEDEM